MNRAAMFPVARFPAGRLDTRCGASRAGGSLPRRSARHPTRRLASPACRLASPPVGSLPRLAGTLGVDRSAPVGFQSIRLFFDLESTASNEDLDALVATTSVIAMCTRRSPGRRS